MCHLSSLFFRSVIGCEGRRRKNHRGVDLLSAVLPFSRLWYGEPNAITNAIGYAMLSILLH
jgi:hypothetical protein